MLNIKNRTIFCRDNLDVLQGINPECIELIYLDPPFNKKKIFTAPIGSSAEGAEFIDIFREEDIKSEWVETIRYENVELYEYLKGVKAFSNNYNYCYLVYMAIRLIECCRVLKNKGSLYLHCDPTMSHYLKIVLDCIFGESNFKNEIIWHYYNGSNRSHANFGRKHDVILFYSKSDNAIYNWDIMREAYAENSTYAEGTKYGSKGFIRGNVNGKLMHDVWKVPSINNMSKERTGYPTQKPLKLLERIIKASSNEGDVILDPFCGCATTCIASEKLGRKWIGIDVSHKAYDLVRERLNKEVPSDMFRADPYFLTAAPKITATTDYAKDTGNVYIISNPAFEGMYKVGIVKNVKSRLNSYQTSDPDRGYKIEYSVSTIDYKEIEKSIHKDFDSQHEWIKANLGDIVQKIENYNEKI